MLYIEPLEFPNKIISRRSLRAGQVESRPRRTCLSTYDATQLTEILYKCECEGTYFVAGDPAGTTKECATCGVETEKPLWVREHACSACGFEADRDANAAYNILQRGRSELGMGCPEVTSPERGAF